MRTCYKVYRVNDNGEQFTRDGKKIGAFDVTEMEEIQTLDGDWVYRDPLTDDDDPRVVVIKMKNGRYRSPHVWGGSIQIK